MPTCGTAMEFVPMFEGEQSFKDLLLSIIVDKILRNTEDSPLPKEDAIGYNDTKVPMNCMTAFAMADDANAGIETTTAPEPTTEADSEAENTEAEELSPEDKLKEYLGTFGLYMWRIY